MSTGDVALPVALRSSPPPLLDHSPSNLSSPLSDMEDKDGEPDNLDVEMALATSGLNGTPNHDISRGDVASSSDLDDLSKLSEGDVNDSEAETERLYHTPPMKSGPCEIIVNGASIEHPLVERRDRNFEPSPSKLQQVHVEADVNDSESILSEVEQEDNDDLSLPPSESDARPTNDRAPSPYPIMNVNVEKDTTEQDAAHDTRQGSVDSRKRKRSSERQMFAAVEPFQKRTGSVAVADQEAARETAAPGGDHSGEEPKDLKTRTRSLDKENPTASIEEESPEVPEPTGAKRSKRNGTKKRKSKSPQIPNGRQEGDILQGAAEDNVGTTAEKAPRPEEESLEAENDEEAEAAHKEEELERKRSAWEELAMIEKLFSNFRERLYQERLEQLNKEEAMLNGPNPTHPEYLAMVQCVDERRDEKIRLGNVELQLNMDVLKKRAVGERAQIMSQFFQAVRESREKVLEAFGQDWYAIQYDRRRQANNIPDYGLRFPTSKAESLRNAVAYNREVSVLSGFAKHVGFPAAPDLHGASDDQLDHDLEVIQRARQQLPIEAGQSRSHRELSASLQPFGHIGPAGEQFIEQTPWLNPNHPSHQHPRQVQDQSRALPLPGPRLPVVRRHSNHAGSLFPSSTVLNGDSSTQMQKSFSAAGYESIKKTRMTAEHTVKRKVAAEAF